MGNKKTTHETWGLKLASGVIIRQGYSLRTLRSEADVRKDFPLSLFEEGAVPVRLSKTTTTYYEVEKNNGW